MTDDTTTRRLRVIGIALIVIGAALIVAMSATDVYTGIKQRQLAQEWKRVAHADRPAAVEATSTREMTPTLEATSTGAEAQRPAGKKPPAGAAVARRPIPHLSPFARIEIPKIRLDAIVVEGVDPDALALGPGHMEETAYPGETGNVVISGHRVTHSHPFYYLDELAPGDPINIYAGSHRFIYRVYEQRVVAPTEVSVTNPTKDRTLTLTTCNPRFSARTRLIVVAKLARIEDAKGGQ